MDDVPHTVVGVLGAGPADHQQNKIWMPLVFTEAQLQSDGASLLVMARLKDDLTVQQANASMAALGARLEQERPKSREGWTVRVEAFRNNFVRDSTRHGIWLLLGAVWFVLLIACANVANLLLARGTARQRELAIRAALGATRVSVVRQLLVESLVLAVAGGVLGTLLAFAIIEPIVALMPPFTLPSETEITLSLPVLVFALVVCTLAGVAAGLAPAWQASRASAAETMKEGGRTVGDRRFGLRRGLVVVEFALALTLLAGGGMAVSALVRMMTADLGFRAEDLTTFSVPVPRGRFTTAEQARIFYESVSDRIAALPGVAAASVSTGMPVQGVGFGRPYRDRRRARCRSVGAAVDGSQHGDAVLSRDVRYFDAPGACVRGHRSRRHLVPLPSSTRRSRHSSWRDASPWDNESLMPPVTFGDGASQRAGADRMGDRRRAGATPSMERPGRPRVAEVLVPFAQNPWPNATVAVRTMSGVAAPAGGHRRRSSGTIDPDTADGARPVHRADAESVDRGRSLLYRVLRGVRRRGPGARGGRDLRRDVVRGGPAHARDRVAHGARGRQTPGARPGPARRHDDGAGRHRVGCDRRGTDRGGVEGGDLRRRSRQSSHFAVVAATLLAAALVACLVPARRAASVDPMVALRQQ